MCLYLNRIKAPSSNGIGALGCPNIVVAGEFDFLLDWNACKELSFVVSSDKFPGCSVNVTKPDGGGQSTATPEIYQS